MAKMAGAGTIGRRIMSKDELERLRARTVFRGNRAVARIDFPECWNVKDEEEDADYYRRVLDALNILFKEEAADAN